MWRKDLDPYVNVHDALTSSFLPIIIALPSQAVSIHVTVYLPTSGKNNEFVLELAALDECLETLFSKYPAADLYLRGD